MFKGAFTTVEITPKIPVDMNGYILRFGKAQGVHDKLFANIFYFQTDLSDFLIISMDIITISDLVAKKIKKLINEKFRINENNIYLIATHTHSSVGSPYLRGQGKEPRNWKIFLSKKIIIGVEEAIKKVVPIEIFTYKTTIDICKNRRETKKIVDKEIIFSKIINKASGSIMGFIINFNCHPVCLKEDNLLLSSDYIHYLREKLKKELNKEDIIIVFSNGGSGDIDPKLRGSFEEAKITGEKIAEKILEALNFSHGGKILAPVLNKTFKLYIPYQIGITKEYITKEKLRYQKIIENSKLIEEKKINKAFLLWAKKIERLIINKRLPKKLGAEISILKIGKIIFIFTPFELFSSTSIKIKKIAPGFFIQPISYSNGYKGYLPDAESMAEGGYEVEEWHKYAGILPLINEAEEIFLRALKNHIREVVK